MAGGGQPMTGGGPGLGAQFVPVCPVPSAQVRCIGPVPVMTRSLAWHDLSPVLTTTHDLTTLRHAHPPPSLMSYCPTHVNSQHIVII